MTYDLIIIGMGPAGISSAVYAKRSGLKVLILEKNMPGGLINYTNIVENYPGFSSISGPDLAFKMFEHINKLNIEYKIEEVLDIKVNKKSKTIQTNKTKYKTKAIIIATGRTNKKLEISKAKSFEGKGISYCAICDGPLFKDKEIAIIGGGNSALEESLYLAKLCKKVTIINRSDKLRADATLQEKVQKMKNIKIKMNTKITDIKGQEKIESIILDNNEELMVSALFIYIGFEPATKFVAKLNITNDYGYILINEKYETKIPGIYACGDIINKKLYQIVTATSEGATAATNAYNYIQLNK